MVHELCKNKSCAYMWEPSSLNLGKLILPCVEGPFYQRTLHGADSLGLTPVYLRVFFSVSKLATTCFQQQIMLRC